MTDFLASLKGLYIVDKDQKAMVPWLPIESKGQAVTEMRKP
jgi:membrane protease subunit HflK